MCAAMLNKFKKVFGLTDEEYDDSFGAMAMPSPEESMVEEQPQPLRRRNFDRKTGSNIIPMNPNMPTGEMIISEPKSFDEAATIVESLRTGKSVIINLINMNKEQAQRLVDFVAGATYAISGNQQKIGEGIFIFTPKTIHINSLPTDQAWLNRENKDLFYRVK